MSTSLPQLGVVASAPYLAAAPYNGGPGRLQLTQLLFDDAQIGQGDGDQGMLRPVHRFPDRQRPRLSHHHRHSRYPIAGEDGSAAHLRRRAAAGAGGIGHGTCANAEAGRVSAVNASKEWRMVTAP